MGYLGAERIKQKTSVYIYICNTKFIQNTYFMKHREQKRCAQNAIKKYVNEKWKIYVLFYIIVLPVSDKYFYNF